MARKILQEVFFEAKIRSYHNIRNLGDVYEQAFVKHVPYRLRSGQALSLPKGRSRDFFTGIPNIYSASPYFGAPFDYVRAGSSHLNEGKTGPVA